jgi:uncharacterized protein YkwD
MQSTPTPTNPARIRRRNTRVATRLFAALAVTVLTLALASCGFPNTSSGSPSDPIENGVYNAMNYDRVANGLRPLTWSPKLSNQAGWWSHQEANMNTLLHQNLSALISSPSYTGYYSLGENILVGPGSMTPKQMESAWMNSSEHRAEILSSAYDIAGVGYYRGGDGRIWVTVDFGGI